MKILHIAAHLGGGVGKAHSAICQADAPDVERHYVLLEQPRDLRYVEMIRQAGAAVTIAPPPATLSALVAKADILQIEWWNHPRLYERLCHTFLPASRTVVWSHISGLFAPYIPPHLLTAPNRFLFTSPCSLVDEAVQALSPKSRQKIGVVNSGFGFGEAPRMTEDRARRVGYLGTVDFSKFSPQFFDVVDRAGLADPVAVWGSVDAGSEVALRAAAMRNPATVNFLGHSEDPESALRRIGIFLYLLQPKHFGTAENALIEAMSLGCVPLVFDNPAERAIVDHGTTGFVASTVEEAAMRLRWMLDHPEQLAEISRNATFTMAATRSPEKSATELATHYRAVLAEPKRKIDFVRLLGATPAEWYLSTQSGYAWEERGNEAARKGSLAHFEQCFPDNASLCRLRQPFDSSAPLRAAS